MSRSHAIALIAIVFLLLAGVAGLNMDLSWLARERTVEAPATPAKPERLGLASLETITGALRPSDAKPDVAAFDIARIDPEGASVFAGRAAPNAEVTILANGKAIASAKANDSGEWSAVTDRRMTTGQTELTLTAKVAERDAPLKGQTMVVDIAPGRGRPELAAPAPRQGPPPVRVASLKGIPDLSGQIAAQPITFLFREATMTSEGRQAASQLASYLRQQRVQSVTLSGHADERGSDQTNLDLSRDRLDVVAKHLRQAGYTGKLVLEPRGKSEPFTGIDRQATPREILFQLDRRVELKTLN